MISWIIRDIQNKALKRLGRKMRPPILPPLPGLSAAKLGIRPQRLNFLSARLGGSVRYLEIGTSFGATLGAVRAAEKTGVDPIPRMDMGHLPRGVDVIVAESDAFFASCDDIYDLIFVDGLHTGEQTYRDIVAAFNILSTPGYVLVDDVLPTDEASALPSMAESNARKRDLEIGHKRWYGDTWKAVAAVLRFHDEIEVCVVGDGETVHGQAVMWRSSESKSVHVEVAEAAGYMKKLSFEDFLHRSARLGWPQEVDTIEAALTPSE